MSLNNGDQIVQARLNAPTLGYAGENGSAYSQTTFAGGPITYLVQTDGADSGLAPSDFRLTGTGTATGRITSVVPAGDGLNNDFTLTIDDIAGDGSLTLGVADPSTLRGGGTFASPLTIDTTPPRILGTTALTPAGHYGAGADLVFAVHFSEAVRPSSTEPLLTLSDGSKAGYLGGSGTSTLLFRHAVKPGEQASDVTPTGFVSNHTILDVAGNAADLSHIAASATGIAVDGGVVTPPTVTGITAQTSAGGTVAAAGTSVTYTVSTSAPVNVLITAQATPPTLVLSDGSRATYTGQDASGALQFTRTIAAGDAPGSLAVTALDLGTSEVDTPPDVKFDTTPEIVPTAGGATSVQVADVNRDGIPDLITAGPRSSAVSVELGTGDGQFAAPVSYTIPPVAGQPTVGKLTTLAVTDVNGDGTPDIVAAGRGAIGVLLGNGDGTFQPGKSTQTPILTALFKTTAVDLHGTGQPDIVLDGEQSIQRQGTSGLSFSDFYDYTTLNAFRWDAASGTLVNDPSFTTVPVAGGQDGSIVDADLDGRLDVVGPTYSANQPGAYVPPTEVTYNDPTTGQPTQGYVGGTGEPPDSLSLSYGLDMLSSWNGVPGGHTPWSADDGTIHASLPIGIVPSVSTTAQLAGDAPCVLSAGQDTLSVIHLGLTQSYTSCLFHTGIDVPVEIATGDINGDNANDVMVGGFSAGPDGTLVPKVSVFLGFDDLTGRLIAAGTYDVSGMGSVPTTGLMGNGFTLADVDGDGKPDIVSAQPGGGVAIYLNQSTPSVSLDASSAAMASALATQTGITVATGAAPTLAGLADATTLAEAPLGPFATATLADPVPNATDTLTIALSGAGGTLAGAGLTANPDGSFTLAGTAAQVTAALQALTFTPLAGQAGTASTTTFTLTAAGSASTATASATARVTDVDPAPSAPVPVAAPTVGQPAAPVASAAPTTGTTPVSVAAPTSNRPAAAVASVPPTTGTAAVAPAAATVDNPDGSTTTTVQNPDGTTSVTTAGGSAFAGKTYSAVTSTYAADGSLLTEVRDRNDGSHHVAVMQGGQTLQSDFFDSLANGGAPSNTFVFDPGHGLDVVSGFRAGGTDHDTLSFLGSDFGNDVATVLRNAHNAHGGVVIQDPTSGDTVRLAGITKAQLVQNRGDIVFHA